MRLRAHWDPLLGHARADEGVLAARVQPGAGDGDRALRPVRWIELAVDAYVRIVGGVAEITVRITEIGMISEMAGWIAAIADITDITDITAGITDIGMISEMAARITAMTDGINDFADDNDIADNNIAAGIR